MHRSNNSSPYPLFERLFAVILSVTDIKDITLGGRIAMVIIKKKPALSKSQFNAVGIHEQARRCLQCGSVIFLL